MSFSHHLSVGFSGFIVLVDELDQIGSHADFEWNVNVRMEEEIRGMECL